jgi:hypothetical protein
MVINGNLRSAATASKPTTDREQRRADLVRPGFEREWMSAPD